MKTPKKKHTALFVASILAGTILPACTLKGQSKNNESVNIELTDTGTREEIELGKRLTAFEDTVRQLCRSNEYDQAVDFMMKETESAEAEFGANSLLVCLYRFHAAQTLEMMGRYAEAEEIYKRLLAISEESMGSWAGTDILYSLAAVYGAQGKYAEADPLLERGLSIQEKRFGPESLRVVGALRCMARNYNVQGKYAEAEPLLSRALAILEKTDERDYEDHAKADCLNMLAVVCENQGRYQEAESHYQQVLAITEASTSADRNMVNTCLNNLAKIYCAEGKYVDAESLYKRVLASQDNMYGPNNLLSAESCERLASLYRILERNDEAEKLEQRVEAFRQAEKDLTEGISSEREKSQ